MAQKAFARTAAYDSAISNWLAGEIGEPRRTGARSAAQHPASARCAMARIRTRARRSTSAPKRRPGVATARQLQGKELSYNNINDTDAAYELRRRIRSAERRGRDHQARQPLRRRHRRDAAGGLREGAELGSRLGLRRRRRAQPQARRGRGAQDRRDLHRSDHRARRRRRGDRDRRGEEEPAAAARRRASRSRSARPDGALRRRRPPGAGPRQWRADAGDAEGRHQARAERARNGRSRLRLARSASTSSRTPSSMSRTA